MTRSPTHADMGQVNQQFYDRLWSEAQLIEPDSFNTWPIVSALAEKAGQRLELGPGLRPRLPLSGTCFVDISEPALSALARHGGEVCRAPVDDLPYEDEHFDLVCALDIIEHVENDRGAVAELARVSSPGASILLSTPLHPDYWTPFDEIVGHYRRYPPEDLVGLLSENGIVVEQSAIFGMKPRSSWLLDFGMWFLKHRPATAMRFYNRLFMPLALKRQRPLTLEPGLIDTDGVDEVFLVCRRQG